MKIIGEFKKFIARGNILDLAVAVVIGGAFTKIVNSFVKDVLMPIISLVLGGNGFENYKYVIVPASVELDGTIIAENAIYYGLFIQNVVDFIIIAFVVFMIVKIINKMKEASNELIDKELEEKKS
jgi:large conductance mechanosensitive channel